MNWLKFIVISCFFAASSANAQIPMPLDQSPASRYSSDAYFPSGSPNYRYEGISGSRYQYDLSNPIDRIEYQVDLDAQMRDQLIVPINPDSSLDRGFGQVGGGISDD